MATNSSVGNQARRAATERNTRDRIHDLTVEALRRGSLKRAEISGLVHQVLDGASRAVDASVPASRTNVLRQVFDGMRDAVSTLASAGGRTAAAARQRSGAVAAQGATAAKHVKSANAEFLQAVKSFSKHTSAEVGEELDALVKRAKRAGGQAASSARDAWKSADGRVIELSGETARAGVTVARRAAGGLASAASGLFAGISDAVAPPSPRPAKAAPTPRAKKTKPKAPRRKPKPVSKS